MERSASLEQALGYLYEVFSNGDADAMERLTSSGDGLVFIGTDPDEWFEDIASIRELMKAQAGAGITVEHGAPKAYEEGTVGWVSDRGHFVLPDGEGRIPFRITAVFHREEEAWRLVQGHTSVAQANEDALRTEV